MCYVLRDCVSLKFRDLDEKGKGDWDEEVERRRKTELESIQRASKSRIKTLTPALIRWMRK